MAVSIAALVASVAASVAMVVLESPSALAAATSAVSTTASTASATTLSVDRSTADTEGDFIRHRRTTVVAMVVASVALDAAGKLIAVRTT